MSNERKNRVFLSYASEDLPKVRKVYEGLNKRGLEVWFDEINLGPGKWKPKITRAITNSRHFVICVSKAAIRKTGDEPGFQDEELNEAYEIAKNQPEKEFTIIPVRLEDCDRGDHRLAMFQQYDLYKNFEKGLDNLSVDMGGTSLADSEAKDERSDDERLIDILKGKAAAEYFAGKINDPFMLDSIKEYTDNLQLILELQNELRMAQARMASQKEIIKYQSADITELRQLIDTALRNPPPIGIKSFATSSLQSDINIRMDFAPRISMIVATINDLKEKLQVGSEEAKWVEKLQQSLNKIENSNSKEQVAKSSAMSKFRRFIENLDKAESTAGKIIKTTKDGIDIARKLAGHYNQIAQWCGLPQVPEPFIKK